MDMLKLDELFEDYINECRFVKRLRPESLRSSTEAFKHFIRMVPEVSTSSDISSEVLSVFFKRLQARQRIVGRNTIKTGVKDTTVASYAGKLRTFFNWLQSRQYIKVNPFNGLSLPRPVMTDHRALTGDEIKRIMAAVAQGSINAFLMKRDMAMIGVLTFCGLRRNELVSLEVRDVDLFSMYITVRPETSKSKVLRRIPINIHLKMHLEEYLLERKKRHCKTAFLFVSNYSDRQLSLHGLKHWVARLVSLSGVKFHLHRFRHTFATNLAMQDVGTIKIQKLMGHSDIRMTQTYLRSVTTEDMRPDVNKLSYENLA